jgi:transcriptional regulator GlxA family with amidase domain
LAALDYKPQISQPEQRSRNQRNICENLSNLWMTSRSLRSERKRYPPKTAKNPFTSAGNLSRLFRTRHGVSFLTYLQRLRIEKAAELLSSTRLAVASVARRVGYRYVFRFGQHFRRYHGETPGEWRVRCAGTRA